MNLLFALLLFSPIHGPTEAQPVWKPVMDGYFEGTIQRIYGLTRHNPAPTFGDLDADGDQDMLLGGWRYVAYLRNDGSPTEPRWTLVSENYLNLPVGWPYTELRPHLADLNDDKALDLLLGTETGNLFYYLNSGDPHTPIFGSGPSGDILDNRQVGGRPTPWLVDIDADGDLDLFVGTSPAFGSGNLAFLENVRTQPGEFSFEITNQNYLSQLFVHAFPCFEDLDGDGDYDLILGSGDGGIPPLLRYFENTGTRYIPSLAAVDETRFAQIKISPSHIPAPCFVNLNNDHQRELVCGFSGGSIQGGLFSFRDDVNDGFIRSNLIQSLLVSGSHLAFSDIDADRDLDIIALDATLNQIELLRNAGTITAPNWTGPFPIGAIETGSVHSFGVADIIMDGTIDLVMGNFSLDLYTYDGSVFRLSRPSYMAGILPPECDRLSPCFFDIDADGDSDLFLGYRQSNTQAKLAFYENVAEPGQPEPEWHLVNADYLPLTNSNTHNSAAPCLADIDHDGDADLFVVVGHVGNSRANFEDFHFFENIGDSRSPLWGTRIDNYLELNGIDFGRASLVDIDDDGDMDLFYSEAVEPGIKHWINSERHLIVSPPVSSVNPHQNLELDVSAGIAPYTWHSVTNPSGAFLIPHGAKAEYVVGSVTSVVDVVEVVDSMGTRGRAHLNVIPPINANQVSKVLIVAGMKDEEDSVWPATDYLARFAYKTCLFKGFSRDYIQYLSPVTTMDVDGNGNNTDDVDAPSTLQSFSNGIVWATDAVTLVVYLVDHGFDEGGKGRFRLNQGGEILTAEQLDVWLDNLQQSSEITVTVIIDCCKSGTFVSYLTPPLGKNRIVITSTALNELTYFLGQGLISFSESFWTSILTGRTVGESFEISVTAMNSYQTPQMDDDGSGEYDRDVDGDQAKETEIGLALAGGSDRPEIGKVIPNQVLNNSSSLVLWVDDVVSTSPVEKVWALVIPPTFQTDPESESPIIDMASVELEYNSFHERYQGSFSDFNHTGTYKVVFYARDTWGSVSLPKQVYINRVDSTERAIVVVGDGSYGPDQPFLNSNSLGTLVYSVLHSRWFDGGDIEYFNPILTQDVDGDSQNDVDGPPTFVEVQEAISESDEITKLTIALIGQGLVDHFRLSEGEELDSQQLDLWLDNLQESSDVEVNVILDFQESGSWADDLLPPSGKKRIVICSAVPSSQSFCYMEGVFSFSHLFWTGVFDGRNIRDSFQRSRPILSFLTNGQQRPGLSDNSNGILNEKSDGNFARSRFIGPGFLSGGDDLPVIQEVSGNIVLTTTETQTTIWCSGVFDSDGIKSVTATLVPPSFPASPPISLGMTYKSSTGRYEITHQTFDEKGEYHVLYTAEDRLGNRSSTTGGTITGLGAGDMYEPDNTSVESTLLVVDWTDQEHDFHIEGDLDWVRFYGDSGLTYTIRATTTSPYCDPVLTLYDSMDLNTPIGGSPVDLGNEGEDEILLWTAPQEGEFFIQVKNYDPGVSGPGTEYQLAVIKESGINNGRAKAISPSEIIISWSPSNSTEVIGTSILKSTQPQGPYTLIANVPVPIAKYVNRGLQPGQSYFFQLIEYDSLLSTRSVSSPFFATTPDDSDQDGISDTDENNGPNEGDNNYDGILDSKQESVATLPAVFDKRYITLVTQDGTAFREVHSVSETEQLPPIEYQVFPFGLITFQLIVPTQASRDSVNILLPQDSVVTTYLMHGYIPSQSVDQWYSFGFDGHTGAIIESNLISLWLMDGDRGDDDLQPNGVVIQRGGPSTSTTSINDWQIY